MDLVECIVNATKKVSETVADFVLKSEKSNSNMLADLSVGMSMQSPNFITEVRKKQYENSLQEVEKSLHCIQVEIGFGYGLSAGFQGNKIGYYSDTFKYSKEGKSLGNSQSLSIPLLSSSFGVSYYHPYHYVQDVNESIKHSQPFPSLIDIYACPDTAFDIGGTWNNVGIDSSGSFGFDFDLHVLIGGHIRISIG